MLAGVSTLMGITTAQTQFPVALHYSTRTDEISDLGATMFHGAIAEPSGRIFNCTMMVTGIMIMAGAVCSCVTHRSRLFMLLTLLLGTGVLGVGIFPRTHHEVHQVLSMVTFISGGFAAASSSMVTRGPFRYIAIVLGLTTLTSVAIGPTLLVGILGGGGVERWVAYPIVLWMVGYGGYVLGTAGHGAGATRCMSEVDASR